MVWIIVASVLVGMVLGACVGVVMMCLMVASSRADAMRTHDETARWHTDLASQALCERMP